MPRRRPHSPTSTRSAPRPSGRSRPRRRSPSVDPPVVVGDGAAFCGMRGRSPPRAASAPRRARPDLGLRHAGRRPSDAVPPGCWRARLDARRPFDVAVVAGAARGLARSTACIARVARRRLPPAAAGRCSIGCGSTCTPVSTPGSPVARLASASGSAASGVRRPTSGRSRSSDVSAMPPDERVRPPPRHRGDRVGRATRRPGWPAPSWPTSTDRCAARLAARDHLRVLVAAARRRRRRLHPRRRPRRHVPGSAARRTPRDADLGLGHLLQIEQIRAPAGEGIPTYDLGMDMEYKRRWADRVDETISVIVGPLNTTMHRRALVPSSAG